MSWHSATVNSYWARRLPMMAGGTMNATVMFDSRWHNHDYKGVDESNFPDGWKPTKYSDLSDDYRARYGV